MASRYAALILCVCASACGLPRDADGTLEHVQNGTMRVGVITGAQAGIEESALVRELAHELAASVEWIPGTESDLLKKVHDREIDMVIGGLTDDSPWSAKVALSKPFREDSVNHVFALPPGENGWLVRVERFLGQRKSR